MLAAFKHIAAEIIAFLEKQHIIAFSMQFNSAAAAKDSTSLFLSY